MIDLQLNHEQIINVSKNTTRCTCSETYGRNVYIDETKRFQKLLKLEKERVE